MEKISELRALSIREPFASLMLHRKIETRTWATPYRGLVLICASQKPYHEIEIIKISGEAQAYRILKYINAKNIDEQPGKAIAIMELIDCRPMEPADEDNCFVKYDPKLYCHVMTMVTPIKPTPWKGSLGYTKVPLSSLIDIRPQDNNVTIKFRIQ